MQHTHHISEKVFSCFIYQVTCCFITSEISEGEHLVQCLSAFILFNFILPATPRPSLAE